jgi:hypothetical protein
MIGPIPFNVPAEFAAGLADGSLIRVGALLKDVGTGQILAHVQESGIAQNLANGVINGALMPLTSLDLMATGFANFQIAQLKTMVEGLQVLQYANLGVAISGIGVSAIGFAMINRRLETFEKQLAALGNKIEKQFSELSWSRLRRHYSQVYTLFEMADQAQYLKNPHAELLSVASALARESGYFRGEVAYLLQQQSFDTKLFGSLARSLALCNAGRVECLMLADELSAASKVALDTGNQYRALFDSLIPTKLALGLLPEEERWEHSSTNKMRQNIAEMNQLVLGVRDATDAALTKPHLIETLIEKEIDGSEYIRWLREEKEHPILLVSAT